MSLRAENWRNHLLASLPVEDLERWYKSLELVHLRAGDVRAGRRVRRLRGAAVALYP